MEYASGRLRALADLTGHQTGGQFLSQFNTTQHALWQTLRATRVGTASDGAQQLAGTFTVVRPVLASTGFF